MSSACSRPRRLPARGVIDGISSNNGARFHAVAYTSLTLVSKPHISVRGGSRLRSRRKNHLPPLGRTRTRAGWDPHRSRIRRSGFLQGFCVAPAGVLGSASGSAARGRGNRTGCH